RLRVLVVRRDRLAQLVHRRVPIALLLELVCRGDVLRRRRRVLANRLVRSNHHVQRIVMSHIAPISLSVQIQFNPRVEPATGPQRGLGGVPLVFQESNVRSTSTRSQQKSASRPTKCLTRPPEPPQRPVRPASSTSTFPIGIEP